MEETWMTEWLSSVFGQFDYKILEALHQFAVLTNGVLTPIIEGVSFFAEKGIVFFLLAVLLMCFRKTRKLGVCMFGAVCCGALITNFVLKDLVARPRPFQDAGSIFHSWWLFIGNPAEDGYSFPSGHVTAAMAAMTSVVLGCKSKWRFSAFGVVLLIAFSRCYLCVHYPTDVLAGMLAGMTGAIVAFFITKLIFMIARRYSHTKLGYLILKFDVQSLFQMKRKNI